MRAPQQTFRRARRMRRDLSRAELRLWLKLRGRAVIGMQFRNQHPIGPFILDFFCSRVALAVEVDGSSHKLEDQIAYDQRRDAWLAGRGILTLRVSDEDVLSDVDRVIEVIAAAAEARYRA